MTVLVAGGSQSSRPPVFASQIRVVAHSKVPGVGEDSIQQFVKRKGSMKLAPLFASVFEPSVSALKLLTKQRWPSFAP